MGFPSHFYIQRERCNFFPLHSSSHPLPHTGACGWLVIPVISTFKGKDATLLPWPVLHTHFFCGFLSLLLQFLLTYYVILCNFWTEMLNLRPVLCLSETFYVIFLLAFVSGWLAQLHFFQRNRCPIFPWPVLQTDCLSLALVASKLDQLLLL